jgi:hypothetical protein
MGLDFSFPLYNAGESRLKTDGYNQYIEVQIGNDIVPIPIRECVGCGTNTDGTKGVRIIEEKLIMIEPK